MRTPLAIAAFAALLAVSGSLTGAVAGAHPESPVAGTVVFTSTRDGDAEIYAINPDGSGLTHVTDNEREEDSSPVPSPDGRLIAFYNSRLDSAVMNADGTGKHKLRDCSAFTVSAWSPDSTRLVCGILGLSIVDAATGTGTRLTPRGGHATWSPDGQTIAYTDGGRMWVVPADGGTPRRIGTREPAAEASWSPDSQRLAYGSSVRSGHVSRLDLFTIAADGTQEQRLVQGIGDAPPQWSPDGSLIAFVRSGGVYTIRRDGSSLQRVAASAGGESVRDLAWAGDGESLLYSRWRYRGAFATDVFIISPNAGTSRALTQPFPTGGTNYGAHWRPGPPVSGTPQTLPPTVSLSLDRKVSLSDPVDRLAADGPRATVYTDNSCRGVLVWNSSTRRIVRTPRLCGYESLGQVVLAGRRLAATSYAPGNTEVTSWLSAFRLGSHRAITVTTTVAYTEGGGDYLGHLVGGAGTIAFTSYHNFGGRRESRQAWLLAARNGGRCPVAPESGTPARLCHRLDRAGGGVTESTDAGRILTLAPGGAARLLSAGGRLLRRWHLGRGVVRGKLGGRALAVQRGVSITAYDASSGRRRQTRPLAANEGRPPSLRDVRGNLAVYVTGGAVHLLRLSDGRDVALELPGAAPPLDARLEPGGLFVAWNQMYSRHPGRLAFVPARLLNR